MTSRDPNPPSKASTRRPTRTGAGGLPTDRDRLRGPSQALDEPGAERGTLSAALGHGVRLLAACQRGHLVPGQRDGGPTAKHRRRPSKQPKESGVWQAESVALIAFSYGGV